MRVFPELMLTSQQSPVPDLPIGGPEWLTCGQKHLEEELSTEQRTQEEREQQLESCAETQQLLVDSIKSILSNHNRQLADVKHLLRAMAKVAATSLDFQSLRRSSARESPIESSVLCPAYRMRRRRWPTAKRWLTRAACAIF